MNGIDQESHHLAKHSVFFRKSELADGESRTFLRLKHSKQEGAEMLKISLRAETIMMIFLIILLLPAIEAQAHETRSTMSVDCEKGQTIKKAIRRARSGDKIVVKGLCKEHIKVNKKLTFKGQGNATIDGSGSSMETSAVVTIDGAQGVEIDGLTIENGSAEGVAGRNGAFFSLKNTTVQGNAGFGISVGDLSRAELVDITTQNNGTGIFAFNNSLVVLRGMISISNNTGFGTNVFARSTLELRGATVRALNNGGIGMAIANGQLMVYGFPDALENSITTNDNAIGFGIGNSTIDISGSTDIIIENNSLAGLFCPDGGNLKSLTTSTSFSIQNNGIGVLYERGCSLALFGSAVTVQGNGIGLLADAADTVQFQMSPSSGSSITGNGIDVDLRFGTRATFNGIDIGTIVCDSTVLSRGSTACP